MTQTIPKARKKVRLVAAWLAGASLAACGRNVAPTAPATASASDPNATALPLTTGPEAPPAPAPALARLPLRTPVRVTRLRDPRQGYAYVDQAYAMSRAIGRAPPDYGFDYGATRPWVWRTSQRALRIVEPIEGGERYYYFQPGATDPYLVQDPRYSYAYAGGALVTVYDAAGRQLELDAIDAEADAAARYLSRARELQQASWRAERRSVVAANWAARRDAIDAERERWAEQEAQHDEWRAYHERHEAEQQAYWAPEQGRRAQTASAFDGWARGGYRASSPTVVAAPLAVAGAALAARAFVAPRESGRPFPDRADRDDRRFDVARPAAGPAYAGARAVTAQNAGSAPVAPPQAARLQQVARDQAQAQRRAVAEAAEASERQRLQTQAQKLQAQQAAQTQALQQARARAETQQAQSQAAADEHRQAAISQLQAQRAQAAHAAEAQRTRADAQLQTQSIQRLQAQRLQDMRVQASQVQASQAQAARQAQQAAETHARAEAQAQAARQVAAQAHAQQQVEQARAQAAAGEAAAAHAKDAARPAEGKGPRHEDDHPHEGTPRH